MCKLFWISASIILLSCLAACQRWEIESLLETRSQALARGDVETYLEAFSPGYHDPAFPRDKAMPRIKKRFESKPYPKVTFEESGIQINNSEAAVTEEFSLEGLVAGKVRKYREIQHLRLKREDNGWKIQSGSEIYRFLAGRLEEQDQIENALERRAEALEHENLDLYMSVVSPGYYHKGKTANEIRQDIQQSFEVFEKIGHRSYDRKIWFFGTTATVQQRFTMEALLMGEPRSWSGTERFEMVRTDQGWTIIKGL